MENSIEQLNSQLNTTLRPLFANNTFVACITLFFTLYALKLAPKLPNSVVSFFDTTLGKFLFVFIIAFVASRDLPNAMNISLLISFIFILAITTSNSNKLQEEFKYMGSEHFAAMNTFNEKSNNKTTIYPLIETLENELVNIIAN